MIARADFDDRESLVRLLERRAGEDFALLGSIESEDRVIDDEVEVLEDELCDDEPDGVQDALDTPAGPESAEDQVDASNRYDSDDVAAPEDYRWPPEWLPDTSDYQDDRQEAHSSPQFDHEAHYPWMDEVRSADDAPAEAPKEKAKEIELPTDPIERLQVLVTAAKYGDEEAVIQIRECLNEHPEIWQQVGDLAAHAEALLIEIIADGNTMVSESMHREIKRLTEELSEGEPSPLERLAIRRIIAAWLHCQYVDRAVLAADAAGSRGAAWGKRQESAERRFQMAVKSLDTVRRLRPRRVAETSTPATAGESQNTMPSDKQINLTTTTTANESKQPTRETNGYSLNNRIKEHLPPEAVSV